jgi:Fe-S cluster assembly protein SufD
MKRTEAALDSVGPPDLQELRRNSLARFREKGYPTPKDETWKNVNLTPITGRQWQSAEIPAAAAGAASRALQGAPENRIVFLNGRFAAELSGRFGGEISVRALSEAFATDPEAVQRLESRVPVSGESAFTLLNGALFTEGVFIEIARRSIAAEPLHLFFFSAPGSSPAVYSPRVLVSAGEESEVCLVERYAALQPGVSFTNAVTRIVVGENAGVEHVKLQVESATAVHVASLQVEQLAHSRFTSHLLSFGAELSRNEIHVRLSGEGGECRLNGLFLVGGRQQADHYTVVDHARPHATSREVYKGILDGHSRGSFMGKVIVRPDAQKTDAAQTNKNLLLSKNAIVNSTPQLQIEANDVKCKHGSTTGQLDEDALFYLRSRGLSDESSRNLLTRAFASDRVSLLPIEELRTAVEAILDERLPLEPGNREPGS